MSVTVISCSEALSRMLDVEYAECRDKLSFEYRGDLTFVVTAPSWVDEAELIRLAREVLPVDIKVEVERS